MGLNGLPTDSFSVRPYLAGYMSDPLEIHLPGRLHAIMFGVFELVLASAFVPAGVLVLAKDHGAGLFILAGGLAFATLGILAFLTSRNNTQAWIWDDRIEWECGFGGRWLALKPLPLSSVEAVVVSQRAKSILLWIKSKGLRSPFRALNPKEEEFPATVAKLRQVLPNVPWSAPSRGRPRRL